MSEGNWSIERYLRYASRIESDDEPIHLYVTLDNIHEILEWKENTDKYKLLGEMNPNRIKAIDLLVDNNIKLEELEILLNTHYDSIDDWRDDMLEVIER